MLKTLVMFTMSGAGAGILANLQRGYHMLRYPHLLALSTALGYTLGAGFSEFEDNYSAELLRTQPYHPLSNTQPREKLLSYQNILKRKEDDAAYFASKDFGISEEAETSE